MFKKLFSIFAALMLSVGLWAQDEPEVVRLSNDILIIDEVHTPGTGDHEGWNYTMHDASVDYITLRTNSTDKFGTFSYDGGTITREIYNITRATADGLEQYSFTSGQMIVAEIGDSIILDGEFLCDDGKKYILHFTHLTEAMNEDTDIDFNMDFEYYQMSSYLNNGLISIETYGKFGMVYLELYTDPAATEIPAGVYVLSDTQEAGTALASSGVVNEEHTSCYAATTHPYTGSLYDLWFMIEGEVTLSYDEYGRLKVAIETANSYNRQAHINIAYQPIEPIGTEEINNVNLYISKDSKRENVYNYMIYNENGSLLTALVVKTDTICGNFENMVDLPQCGIRVPGAIYPYYLIDAKPFTVSAEGKDLSVNVSVLAADTILYVITGTGYIDAAYPDTQDEYDGRYTIEDIDLKQVDEGVVELSATNAGNDEFALVFSATLKEDGTLAAGEYTDIVPSVGITEEGQVAPSVVIDANSNVWLIQSGKLTVAADGLMAFEGLNTYDKKVKITISPSPITGLQEQLAQPTITKFLRNGQLIIRKGGKEYNAMGAEVTK